jgi:hypothetical protein
LNLLHPDTVDDFLRLRYDLLKSATVSTLVIYSANVRFLQGLVFGFVRGMSREISGDSVSYRAQMYK